MDVVCDGNTAAVGLCGVEKLGGTDGRVTAPLPNGSANHITEDQTSESSINCDVSTRISLTEDVSANESSCLLIHPDEESSLSEETAFPHPEAPADSVPTSQLPNGLPVCTPPSAVRPPAPPLQFYARKPDTRRHHSASAANSPNSLKSSSRAVANERCAQCILSCLFCEVLTACSLLVQCLNCSQACEPLLQCCCTCESAECGLCGVDTCLDYRQCLESPSGLEMCMECCSICFSA
ncbi:myoD family inhibitor-like isoform X1 [Brienomyrus brachyistius]|uniref:myoD family inhibitor-like isoform X1 n=1 Tax=Brienomyrus brachyistius TaxID=42636 RepID=UPI0020B45031|nr:myoD family inhibitor-like isoform X1 [Brienomyrus brachyistius]XP_048878177.1 myoD family inhibitor-like isoform X1 [Brienomyrus brachyistius]